MSTLAALLLFSTVTTMQTPDLFTLRSDSKPRIVSFENITGAPGQGGAANKQGKGHAFEMVKPGDSRTLMDVKGPGIVRHIWMTMRDRDPKFLRSLRFEIFWEEEAKPAVSVPVGDFFGTGLAHRVPFESALFRDPEGRSFNCTIPMPFRKAAKVVITNESDRVLQLFYSIAYSEEKAVPADAGYFHAFWNRVQRPELGDDYDILPSVKGHGRFLGTNLGVLVDPKVLGTWFGEGEVKMYLDGDKDLPTWVGTGTEDYICTAYGQGAFHHAESGCTVANEKEGQWAYYRYHLSDPVFFEHDCRVRIQVMGGWFLDELRKMRQAGAEIKPVTVDTDGVLLRLLDLPQAPDLDDPAFPDGWVNFYRRDDYSSTAYFYLDRPSTELPRLPGIEARIAKMEGPKE